MSGKCSNSGKIDRRSARTRRLLHQALMQLILKRDYDAITVQEIIDEADVGRATFYAHYAGKDDLLRRGFEHFRAELADAQAAPAQPPAGPSELAFAVAVFEHAGRYKGIYRALIGSRASAIVLREFRRMLLEVIKPQLGGRGPTTVPDGLLAHFVADATQSVIMWWVELHPELPARTVHQMFRDLVAPLLHKQVGQTA